MRITILNIIDILFYFAALKHTFFLTPLIDNFDHLFQFFSFLFLSLSLFKSCSVKSRRRGERIEVLELKAELFASGAILSGQFQRCIDCCLHNSVAVAQHHCSFIYLLINKLPPFVDLFSDLFLSQ